MSLTAEDLDRRIPRTELGTVPVSAFGNPGPEIDASGVTVVGSKQILAANADRRYLFVQNLTGLTVWVNFGSAATAGGGSRRLGPNDAIEEDGTGFVHSQAVFLHCGSAGLAYTAKEA